MWRIDSRGGGSFHVLRTRNIGALADVCLGEFRLPRFADRLMKRLVNLDLHVQGFKYDRGTMTSDNHRGFVAHQDLPRWVILGFEFVKHHTRCAGQTLAVHAFWNRYRIDGIVLKSMKNLRQRRVSLRRCRLRTHAARQARTDWTTVNSS